MNERGWEMGTTYEPPEEGGKSLEDYEKILGISKESLEGKMILDLGSGEMEKLSKDIKKEGIEAEVISLNPDYSIDPFLRKNTEKEDSQKMSLAAIGQNLPFKDSTFDLILAMESVSRYSSPSKNLEDAKFWANEIVRVLKNNGEARLWPIIELNKKYPNKEVDKNKKLISDEFVKYIQELGVKVRIESWPENVDFPIGYRMVINKITE
jgi:ubiquinone/menaquinone biosynthesis C-methylase UbiE